MALRADQNRHLGTHLALPGSVFGSVHDFEGLFSETHALISRRPEEILVETWVAAAYPALIVPLALVVPLLPGQMFTPATQAS